MAWQNNNALLYGAGNQLYSFSLKDSGVVQLSAVPVGSGVSGIYSNFDGSEVYVLATKNNDSNRSSLLRVGLTAKAQNVPDYYSTLGIFFPSSAGQCSFSYTNFLRPVLLITAWADENACIEGAKQELRADGLPLSGFQITFQKSIDE
jgi:hypothetical protein